MPIEHANRGKPPRDASIPLGIRWANGMTAKHTYTASNEVVTWGYACVLLRIVG
jgi:hypothetical protein